jgi:hypothetical protein
MPAQLLGWLMLALAALAWARYAKHPTVRNLRSAAVATIRLW